MFRFLLRNALLLTLLTALPIVLIRAQPYDDSDLRAFLTPPEGCPAPCFMGIRPGLTMVDEAVIILEDHEWVAGVDEEYARLVQVAAAYEPPSFVILIHWKWSDHKPDWINDDLDSNLAVISRQIEAINLETHVSLGDVLLTYGVPNNSQRSGWFGDGYAYHGWYASRCMSIGTALSGSLQDIYLQPVWIKFQRSDADLTSYGDCGQ